MPVYVYECTQGHTYDAEHSMPPVSLKKCPICGRMGSLVIQPVAFVLRGDGWARDGYGLRKGKA